MNARNDYAFPAAVADGRVNGGAYGRRECADALDEIDALRRWKAEAIPLLELLERCHELLPPDARAGIGYSKADSVEKFLRRANPQRDAELMADHWFAAVSDDEDAVNGAPWQPFVQIVGACLPLPIWFRTERECQDFISTIPSGGGDA